ncbi:hypothetical protein RHMOL_Rhmol13G0128600 [Rhododendron molle]|uniref:Uncharacterized protein n=1 Tax=Rhododendron molle TaxID=49168 RepID=A0ACC0L5Z3_RHOML|nr:hypothetical protein RHMOL_Rhmol13G0128600 [Rhododendron molle]
MLDLRHIRQGDPTGHRASAEEYFSKEFESRLEHLLQDLQVDCNPITTSNTTWDIPVNEYGQFNAPAPNKVFAAIELELYDYVFISMLPNMEVRIVVFSGTDDAERIYDWFADD